MSIKINRLEEEHNSYPLVCRRPAETVSLQKRQICYRWGTPAYWSLVPRSSMFYLFEFCLKNISSLVFRNFHIRKDQWISLPILSSLHKVHTFWWIGIFDHLSVSIGNSKLDVRSFHKIILLSLLSFSR